MWVLKRDLLAHILVLRAVGWSVVTKMVFCKGGGGSLLRGGEEERLFMRGETNEVEVPPGAVH